MFWNKTTSFSSKSIEKQVLWWFLIGFYIDRNIFYGKNSNILHQEIAANMRKWNPNIAVEAAYEDCVSGLTCW